MSRCWLLRPDRTWGCGTTRLGCACECVLPVRRGWVRPDAIADSAGDRAAAVAMQSGDRVPGKVRAVAGARLVAVPDQAAAGQPSTLLHFAVR